MAEATTAELADVLRVNPRRIQQLAGKKGILRRTRTKRFPVGESIGRYIDYRNAFVAAKSDATATAGYATSRARKEAAAATIAEMDLASKQGKLLKGIDVEAAWTEILSRVRARVLAIPASAGVRLASETDPKTCITILEEEVREALEELSDDPDYGREALVGEGEVDEDRSPSSSETEDI